jgi:hypothetical protein
MDGGRTSAAALLAGVKFRSRCFLASVLVGIGIAPNALGGTQPGPDENSIQDGQAGFVVSHLVFALSDAASNAGACPMGVTPSAGENYAATHPSEVQQRPDESDNLHMARLWHAAATLPSGDNVCVNPQLAGPDPTFRSVTTSNVPVYGIDLDGKDSHAIDRPAPGMCAHDDFHGMNGEHGVDNQFFRVVGCIRSFQPPDGVMNNDSDMRSGHWGILVVLKGVHDLRNEATVQVEFLANADPIELAPTKAAVPNATYTAEQDPRFRASARGRIVNGVLTTQPVDFRFHQSVSPFKMRMERLLRDARLQLTFAADGSADGYLAGYAPIDDYYANSMSYTAATFVDSGSSGAASPKTGLMLMREASPTVQGYTCNGVYNALQHYADGNRDPKTGQCTSISMQYRIHVVPAFVVDQPKTKS